ncbi:uncharacterized protein LOC110466706 [Mizuhopecten yessoensis]|uniref:Fibroblast growth factor 13 n=1 Tax=Mizuhopecten yessoensis TaxID=6573 RepID=A0A210PNJ8_MIZYE|nr:uncharacterized protein LOC110466706 [Mizuhopecten yessoensis]XP_021379085.1 uncharacterized protein LOC110466706 [Mizuhopecten yessoensis]XP_021379086.1 uncharacterized protein LOC110466706 [Mizuhopecten yessoensis]XP_021379087.1 uncharacterized protein LOC110466706 [Mizuhopecten yessoensis]OWF38043.1 Fibroblast growth factor 13 [Mizuhopecten yessoensis]
MTTYVTPSIPGVDHFTTLALVLLCLLTHLPIGISMSYSNYGHPDAGEALKNERFDWEPALKGSVFIAINDVMLLQITADGAINGTKCRSSRYAMLKTTAHHIKELKNKKVIVVQGTETKRYLCMNGSGQLYASEPGTMDEMECSFSFNEQWIQSNDSSFNKTVFRLSRLRHHKNPYYVGLSCDGKPIVAKDCKHRRQLRKYLLFNMGNFKPEENSGSCDGISPPKCKRTYLKFCRKVVRNYFKTSLKGLNQFRKRHCFKRLRREKDRNRKIADRCNLGSSRKRGRSRRRHRRHPT